MTAMHTTPKRAWARAIAQTAQEFAPTPLAVVAGSIPPGLRGSLYRNGVARLERGGIHVGHWFDGDGAVLGVHFTDAGAIGVYRYVNTAGYLAESEAGELCYGGYGMTAPGPIWNHWSRPLKNAANTSVLALPDRLLALWEGGQPHALDLQTLTTIGLDDLSGLEHQLPYSAHPKQDPHTGTIFNFGVSIGINGTLNLYKSHSTSVNGDRPGTIQQKAAIPLAGFPLIHDFALAGPYLVFCIPPVRLNVLPVLIGLQAFSDAATWKPELGTQILVIDRETLTVVSRSETDPWFQWHFGNGFVDTDGQIVLDVARYPNFQTNRFLKEVATGQTQTLAKSTLWRIRLDPQTAEVKAAEELLDRSCEFLVVPPAQVGQNARFTYLSIHRPDADLRYEVLGSIARFDHQTHTLLEANLGENSYPSEPLYAADRFDPKRGWVLTVVFDGDRDQSEVWIFDSDRLHGEPVCRLALPGIIPLSFHGTWQPLP